MKDALTPTYLKALDLHREIESLYPIVEQHRAWFRNMSLVGKTVPVPVGTVPLVDLDRVYCALAIKAATTKRAVFSLCEAGDGDNAYALSRVILENGVLMRWMLDGRGRERLDTYVLFMSVLHERTISLVERHYHDRKEFREWAADKSDPYHVAIAEAVFDDNENTWAYFPDEKSGRPKQTRIKKIFEDAVGLFAYEGPYAMASQFIHSGPESLSSILIQLTRRQFFELSPQPSRSRCGMALSDSNLAMLIVLDALSDYVGLGLDERIKSMMEEWQAFARSTFSGAADETAPPN